MSDLANQVIQLRREMELLRKSQVVISDTEPRSPTSQSIWRQGASLSTWNGKNWIDTTGGGEITDFANSVFFSSSAYNSVSWSAGAIQIGTSTGVSTHSISSGSFTMSVPTFFYWSPSNPNSIQTTTTPATAVTSGGLILAVGQVNSDPTIPTASVKTFGNNQNDLITADQIVANGITANKLASQLIYAGSLIINTGGLIRGGQTAYNTGVGFFLGYSGGAYKLSIGDPSTNYLAYDGSGLVINGGTIRTGTSGQRVEISGSNMRAYNSSGNLRLQTSGTGMRFTDAAGSYNLDLEGGNYSTLPALKVSGAVRLDALSGNAGALNIFLHTGQLSFRDVTNGMSGTVLSSPNDDTLVVQGTTITLNGKNLYSNGTDLFWNGVKIN